MTEAVMATPDRGIGPGEAADRARRRRLWWLFATLFGAGLPIGFFAALLERGGDSGVMSGTLPAWFAVVAAAVFVVAVGGGGWLWHRRMDELDRRDNLVAASAGGNLMLGGYPVWFVLWKGGLVGAPDALGLFVATFVVSLVTYAIIKYRQFS